MRRFLFAVLLVVACETGATAGLIEDGESAIQREDYTLAMRLFRPLAEQGNAWAQSYLGVAYRDGKGVRQDYEEALKWFRKAAEQENDSAQSDLGLMYATGRGVPQDYQTALKWYRKAAERGND